MLFINKIRQLFKKSKLKDFLTLPYFYEFDNFKTKITHEGLNDLLLENVSFLKQIKWHGGLHPRVGEIFLLNFPIDAHVGYEQLMWNINKIHKMKKMDTFLAKVKSSLNNNVVLNLNLNITYNKDELLLNIYTATKEAFLYYAVFIELAFPNNLENFQINNQKFDLKTDSEKLFKGSDDVLEISYELEKKKIVLKSSFNTIYFKDGHFLLMPLLSGRRNDLINQWYLKSSRITLQVLSCSIK